MRPAALPGIMKGLASRAYPTRWLLGFLGMVVLVPLGLVFAYVWQAGLDLQVASSVRQYLDLCSRGQEDIACKALRIEAKSHTGPLTVLKVGPRGDREATTALSTYLSAHGYAPSALIKDPQVIRV